MHLKQAVATYSQHDYEQLHQELRARYEQQLIEAFMDHHPGWSVVEGNAACMMYLYRNWVFAEKAEVNAARLKALADDLIKNYEDCEEEFLTAELATKAMGIADRVYNFTVCSEMPVSFCLPVSGKAQEERFLLPLYENGGW